MPGMLLKDCLVKWIRGKQMVKGFSFPKGKILFVNAYIPQLPVNMSGHTVYQTRELM